MNFLNIDCYSTLKFFIQLPVIVNLMGILLVFFSEKDLHKSVFGQKIKQLYFSASEIILYAPWFLDFSILNFSSLLRNV